MLVSFADEAARVKTYLDKPHHNWSDIQTKRLSANFRECVCPVLRSAVGLGKPKLMQVDGAPTAYHYLYVCTLQDAQPTA